MKPRAERVMSQNSSKAGLFEQNSSNQFGESSKKHIHFQQFWIETGGHLGIAIAAHPIFCCVNESWNSSVMEPKDESWISNQKTNRNKYPQRKNLHVWMFFSLEWKC